MKATLESLDSASRLYIMPHSGRSQRIIFLFAFFFATLRLANSSVKQTQSRQLYGDDFSRKIAKSLKVQSSVRPLLNNAQLSIKKFQRQLFLRGGSSQITKFQLFLRIFNPNYGESNQKDSKDRSALTDTHQGVIKRIKVFLRALLGKANLPKKSEGGTSEKDGLTEKHLSGKHRPGDSNYRIQKELQEFIRNPPNGCQVSVGKNLRIWIITITGADGTLFEGEKFKLRVAFPDNYPHKPPSVYFLQNPPPPEHEHVYTNGDICLSLLGKDWTPNLTASSLALSILSMLSSAKEKRRPADNFANASRRPGQSQENWVYHDNYA